jgi:hypothetical protein
MGKIILYHGTSKKYADKIMKEGFKSRSETGNSNWDHTIISHEDFVYLTYAYAFYFAQTASSDNHKIASIIKVEVDEEDIFPDEDFIRQVNKIPNCDDVDIIDYKHCGNLSLDHLGNCCAYPNDIKILERKDFKLIDMFYYSDPTITLMNYKIMKEYYKELIKRWWNGEDYKSIDKSEMIKKALSIK